MLASDLSGVKQMVLNCIGCVCVFSYKLKSTEDMVHSLLTKINLLFVVVSKLKQRFKRNIECDGGNFNGKMVIIFPNDTCAHFNEDLKLNALVKCTRRYTRFEFNVIILRAVWKW